MYYFSKGLKEVSKPCICRLGKGTFQIPETANSKAPRWQGTCLRVSKGASVATVEYGKTGEMQSMRKGTARSKGPWRPLLGF